MTKVLEDWIEMDKKSIFHWDFCMEIWKFYQKSNLNWVFAQTRRNLRLGFLISFRIMKNFQKIAKFPLTFPKDYKFFIDLFKFVKFFLVWKSSIFDFSNVKSTPPHWSRDPHQWNPVLTTGIRLNAPRCFNCAQYFANGEGIAKLLLRISYPLKSRNFSYNHLTLSK